MLILLEKSIELFDEIINTLGDDIPDEIIEKIESFIADLDESEAFAEALEKVENDSEENKVIEDLKKVVYRAGKRTVVTKKKMKAGEKLARSKAAKKAGMKRKGKKMKAGAIAKLKKSLKARGK